MRRSRRRRTRSPGHPHRPVVEGELGGLRDERQAQPIGNRSPEQRATAVARLLPEQHEIGTFTFEHLREHLARRDEVRSVGEQGR